jgi:hypothetical protein
MTPRPKRAEKKQKVPGPLHQRVEKELNNIVGKGKISRQRNRVKNMLRHILFIDGLDETMQLLVDTRYGAQPTSWEDVLNHIEIAGYGERKKELREAYNVIQRYEKAYGPLENAYRILQRLRTVHIEDKAR